jgi:hypothetical protein
MSHPHEDTEKRALVLMKERTLPSNYCSANDANWYVYYNSFGTQKIILKNEKEGRQKYKKM